MLWYVYAIPDCNFTLNSFSNFLIKMTGEKNNTLYRSLGTGGAGPSEHWQIYVWVVFLQELAIAFPSRNSTGVFATNANTY